MKPAAFLDRDGVINIDRGYVFRRADFAFVPGTLEAARRLKELGLALVVITNQSGIARGYYRREQYEELAGWMRRQFEDHGAPLDGMYYCPHHPTEGQEPDRQVCSCRKPAPGLLLEAAHDLALDLRRSVMFGDNASDLQAALAAGVPHRVLVGRDGIEYPNKVLPAGLATHRYRSLADALHVRDFRKLLAGLAGREVDA